MLAYIVVLMDLKEQRQFEMFHYNIICMYLKSNDTRRIDFIDVSNYYW